MTLYIEDNTYVVKLKAGELKTEKQFAETLWKAFSLPYGFEKHSLDALDDWMRDLSWLNYTSFRITVTGYNSHTGKGNDLDFVKSSLELYKAYWDMQEGYTFEVDLK